MAMKIVVGRMYHVAGWKQGTFFRLRKVDEDLGLAFLETPKTRRKYHVSLAKLRNIKKYGALKENPYAQTSPPNNEKENCNA